MQASLIWPLSAACELQHILFLCCLVALELEGLVHVDRHALAPSQVDIVQVAGR